MKKTSLLIGVLTFASLAFAGGKTYDVTISKLSKVGSVQLAPGAYKLKLDGSNAVFTDARHRDFSIAVKVESSPRKFQFTAIDSTGIGDAEQIHSITLAGSTTKIDFAE